MNFVEILKLVGAIFALFIVYSLLTSAQLIDKFIGIGIALGLFWYFFFKPQSNVVIDPVQVHYDRLREACLSKPNRGNLGRILMTGDKYNQAYVKGWILGGPIYRFDKRLPDDHPFKTMCIFLYTNDSSPLWDNGIYSALMGIFGRKRHTQLFGCFLYQLKSKYIYGDVNVKGINSKFIEQLELVNDEILDADSEMRILSEEVDRITLADNLAMMPSRIRVAVDSNSMHIRQLDTMDLQGGWAQQGQPQQK